MVRQTWRDSSTDGEGDIVRVKMVTVWGKNLNSRIISFVGFSTLTFV